MKKVLIIHGPNLQLLGQREQGIYGSTTLDEINNQLNSVAKEFDIELNVMQSNHEGDIVDNIGKAKDQGFNAILINPAAYTHTSIAIRDAISAIELPTVEVHLSNVYAREEFRHMSLLAPVCKGQVSGFGVDSYILGLQAIVKILNR